MEEYKTILEKTDGGLDIFSYYLGKECLKKSSRAPSEVATTVRPAICISTSLQESKPTTISRTLATADVAATPLQSLQGC